MSAKIPQRTYRVSYDDADVGSIMVDTDGDLHVDAPSPHAETMQRALSDIREHGVTDLGIATLKEPAFVEGVDLFYALWNRLLMMGYVLERVDKKE